LIVAPLLLAAVTYALGGLALWLLKKFPLKGMLVSFGALLFVASKSTSFYVTLLPGSEHTAAQHRPQSALPSPADGEPL
jgi:hypothetical protein